VEKGQSSRRGKSSSLGLGRSGVVKTTEVPGSDWSYNPISSIPVALVALSKCQQDRHSVLVR
jgi:hypothetical protein